MSLTRALTKPRPVVIDENRAEIFFGGAIFLGEWNPNININQLPSHKVENGIFIISETGKFKNSPLNKGQLIKYINENSQLMRFQNFVPFDFLQSFVNHFQQDSNIGDINNLNLVQFYNQL